MVSQEQSVEEQLAAMSDAERDAWWKERHTAQAVAWGMPESLEWLKDEDDGEGSSGVAEETWEARDQSENMLPGDWLEELGRQHPDDTEFFRKLDERFPNGYRWIHIVDPVSEAGEAFFAQLKANFPEAWEFFRGDGE